MKHHFGDFLDRTDDYWTTIPNRERFAFIANFEIGNKEEVKILTIGKGQKKEHWLQIFDCPNLEELTLNNPSKEQVHAIRKLTHLKRLRVTFFRAKDIDFIGELYNLEELVLEYVSGFTDLSPLTKLTKLKSLHFENLRKVKNFDGLSGINSLKYLYINGTLDWKQPIENFEFLKGLQNLEVLALIWVINKTPYPAFKPITELQKLKKINVISNMFPTEEFAYLETVLPNVEGAVWEPFKKVVHGYCNVLYLPKKDSRSKLSEEILKKEHPEVSINHEGRRIIKDPNPGYFEFLGKGAGKVKCNNPKADEKCLEFKNKYEDMKLKAQKITKGF
ncbi:leucine-rich repeat domain-containing protein [Maribacter forsetii]|uniref:leucine-rich repeat domain-containing protein n=1 Tax=Maribacter forsetii TaxID=444515 RepID=UPI00055ADC17|nr:leucine-rich repeat domain-containing protein [Maribacter forsetii]